MSINTKKIKNQWLKHKAVYKKDELLINNFQVMQRWEDNYMRALASVATMNGGHILECGFGLGISASYIQKSKKIKSHTIIECHPGVIRKAQKIFKDKIAQGKLILINGFWEDVTPKLKDNFFDGILFDTGPIDKEVEFFHFFPFFKEAYRLLKKGGVFTYFSDEAKGFSKKHLNKLISAGFKKNKINFEICNVNPPKSCRYWEEKTIIVPIVFK
jgi:guanidinoacetate N-methyltransferase